ncbi:hypothetical protein PA01_11685 [Azoarcus sp. PA01]|nr:hypothetical protein PA01_11685 [Azoarcus sp. PA01]
MVSRNPAVDFLRLCKRYIEFSKQIVADLSWHRAQCRPDFRTFRKRVTEQTRLLHSNAICAEDYYHLALYRDSLTAEQKRTFLGSYEKWRYFNRLNPAVYDVIARDKALFHIFAASSGIRTPDTLATTAAGHKPFFGRRLDTVEATRRFLCDNEGEELFFKPADGSLGEGAMAVGRSKSNVGKWEQIPDRIPITVEEILRHLVVDGVLGRFLIQRRLKPNEALAKIVPEVCPTARIMTLTSTKGVDLLGAALRMGSGHSPTDNVAGGGLIAPIEMETGTLRLAVCLDSGTPEAVTRHPFTHAPLQGIIIPQWNEVIALVRESATRLNFLPCIGWDIGLTDEGPVVIEINTRPRCISVQTGVEYGLLSGPLGRELAKTAGRLNNGLTIPDYAYQAKQHQAA